MSNIGIRFRVLLLTLIPLLLFTLVIGEYTVMSRIQDVEQALQERGETIVRHLATESEFSLFSEDLGQLRRIAEASVQEGDVHEVRILDANGDLIVRAGKDRNRNGRGLRQVSGQGPSNGTVISFVEPVYSSGIPISDNDEQLAGASGVAGAPIGRIELDMSTENTLARQASIIRDIVLIASATALFTILIAFWMGRGIVDPVIRLSRAVDDVRKGYLGTRVVSSTGGEIGALEQGFNDMAEVMERSQQRLQSDVQEATGKLQETIRELEQKNRELEVERQKALVAGNEKANFLANMSHEIRTPINAILGYTSLLEKSNLSLEQYEYTRTIGCASTQLLRVIDDILSFSKLESGTVEADYSDFDLRDLLEDVLCMMGPEAREKLLELVLLIDSDVPMKLNGDAVHLRQVIINLMSNAIKFTEQGGVTVQVALVAVDDDRIEIELQVIDSGIGISSDVVNRIFSSFHQADASISRRYGGTGLGLAIVSRLVNFWDGRIGVSSEPGAGSTFWFTFKCSLQPCQEDHAVAEQLAGRKVLLFDDNPVACRAVRNLLLTWSMDVYLARQRDRIEEMLAGAQESEQPFEMVVFGIGVEYFEDGDELDGRVLGRFVDLIRNRYRLPLLLMVNCRRTTLLSRSLSDRDLKIVIKPVRRDILHRNICRLLGVELTEGNNVADPEPAQLEGDEGSTEFHGLRLLLAEDNEFNRTLVSRILEGAGIEVFRVASGNEALELLQAQDIDLILMDLHLPGMDGIETTRRLRRLRPALRHIPVIALTADVFFNVPEKLRETEFDACLLKPLDEGQLWNLIRTLCLNPPADARDPYPREIGDGRIPENMKSRLHEAIRDQQKRIAETAAAGDCTTLSELVHELKGVVGYFGMRELTEAVNELERCVETHSDVSEVHESVAKLGWIIEREITPLRETVD